MGLQFTCLHPKNDHHLITYNLKTIVIVTHHSLSVQMCSFILYSYYKTMHDIVHINYDDSEDKE